MGQKGRELIALLTSVDSTQLDTLTNRKYKLRHVCVAVQSTLMTMIQGIEDMLGEV